MNSRWWSHALLFTLGACLVLGAPSAFAADGAAAPLSVRIGGAEFTPGGTVDMTGIFYRIGAGFGNAGMMAAEVPYSGPRYTELLSAPGNQLPIAMPSC